MISWQVKHGLPVALAARMRQRGSPLVGDLPSRNNRPAYKRSAFGTVAGGESLNDLSSRILNQQARKRPKTLCRDATIRVL
ncbi:MAG: hypothetical protein ACI87E_001595 [Mariniblastus sp.]|jgi:hypothetical protein